MKADALSRKSIGSLSHIVAQRRDIISDLQRLFEVGLSLEATVTQPLIAQFWMRPILIDEIEAAQDSDTEFVKLKSLISAGQETKFRVDYGALKLNDRLCIPNVSDLMQKILKEAHQTAYSVHPRATKMYHDIKHNYWWNGLKRDVAQFVASCLTYQQVKFEHQKPTGLLQEMPLLKWKWE